MPSGPAFLRRFQETFQLLNAAPSPPAQGYYRIAWLEQRPSKATAAAAFFARRAF
jgi:hypothetical protein